MADWTLISDAALDPDAPLTSDLGYAWRDNPVAIAEGAVSAPYARTGWHPYNSTLVGDSGTGEIWSFAANGAVATIETPDFVDGYEYRLVFDGLGIQSSGATEFRVELFRQASGAYSGVVNMRTIGSTAPVYGYIDMDSVRKVSGFHTAIGPIVAGLSNSQVNNNVNTYALITHSTPQKILKARISPSVLTFNAGAVYLYRRRAY